VVDIESRPQKNLVEMFNKRIKAPSNYKEPKVIEAYIEKAKLDSVKAMSVDTDYNEIFCIGAKANDEDAKLISLDELGQYILDGYILVTFNGKKFDLPTIIKNGIKQGLKLPYFQLKQMCKRWDTSKHIDLMELLGEEYRSLDTYLQIYLGISKKEIDFATCTNVELVQHNIEDVNNTYKLFKLFEQLV